MKKELFSGALLLGLIVLSIVNLNYLKTFSDELTQHITESREACERGDCVEAEKKLRTALEIWLGAESYTHIFIRHSEIDETGDAFYDLLGNLRAGDCGAASGAYEKLLSQISSLYTMDKPRLGSIF